MIRRTLLSVSTLAAVMAGAHAEAATKAKYYADCLAPVTAARDLVPPPPADIAGKAKKAGEVADTVGKIGGLVGFGGLGGLGKVASTTSQVAKYSNVIADAAQFTTKMREDYPDAATRLAAYGDKMATDADKIGQAGDQLDAAQACYEKAHGALIAGVEAKEIKGKDASSRQKEIQSGVTDVTEILDDARVTMDTNIKAYNDALNTDTSSMGLNLGSLASAASMAGVNPMGAVGGGDTASQIAAQGAAYRAAVVTQSGGATDPNTNYAQMAQSYSTLGSLSQLGSMAALTNAGPLGAANIAAAAASAASNTSAPAPAIDVAPDMMKSLTKVGADSTKYMATYQRIGAQAEKAAALKTAVGAKLP